MRRWSGYKYELRFALFSDEWSCRSVGTSFQSLSLPLIPRPRPEGSCENWKWQSNQHVEQADWTKLSWPRSELFNTGPIGGLCYRGCSRAVWEPETQRGERQRSSGKQEEERETAWSKVYIKLCEFSPKSLISTPTPPPPATHLSGGWIGNVCITCDLMSTWCCHMKDLFPTAWKASPVNLDRVSSAWSHEAPSEAISSPPSIQMIINHVIITLTGVHLRNRGREIFLSGGRITYDPFMSRWEPLKIIIHHSRGSSNNRKAPSVINLMGFAYFSSLTRIRQKKSHKREEYGLKKNSQKPQSSYYEGCVSPQLTFWLKTPRFQGKTLIYIFFKFWYLRD